jgi:hypothetical protein
MSWHMTVPYICTSLYYQDTYNSELVGQSMRHPVVWPEASRVFRWHCRSTIASFFFVLAIFSNQTKNASQHWPTPPHFSRALMSAYDFACYGCPRPCQR